MPWFLTPFLNSRPLCGEARTSFYIFIALKINDFWPPLWWQPGSTKSRNPTPSPLQPLIENFLSSPKKEYFLLTVSSGHGNSWARGLEPSPGRSQRWHALPLCFSRVTIRDYHCTAQWWSSSRAPAQGPDQAVGWACVFISPHVSRSSSLPDGNPGSSLPKKQVYRVVHGPAWFTSPGLSWHCYSLFLNTALT